MGDVIALPYFCFYAKRGDRVVKEKEFIYTGKNGDYK